MYFWNTNARHLQLNSKTIVVYAQLLYVYIDGLKRKLFRFQI